MNIEFDGIVKIPSTQVTISQQFKKDAENLTNKYTLIPLQTEKRHITLLHQSVEGLKPLLKAHKRALKANQETPIKFPDNFPKDISVHSIQFLEVDNKQTVRFIIEQQKELFDWVTDFCNLNNLTRDETEIKRIFHVSYSNKTGIPKDSVR